MVYASNPAQLLLCSDTIIGPFRRNTLCLYNVIGQQQYNKSKYFSLFSCTIEKIAVLLHPQKGTTLVVHSFLYGMWRSPASASGLGPGGRRFESFHPDTKYSPHLGDYIFLSIIDR